MEKIKIYVMESCPDCTQVKMVAKNDPRFEVVEIGEHISKLKEFIRLRDSNPKFDGIKRLGHVGIPAFLLPDGNVVFSAEKAGLDLTGADKPAGAACSIDGTGC